MRFCVECGEVLVERVPPGDERLRMVCPGCGHVAYENPKVVAGTLPIADGKVLLLRRGIEPSLGKWTYAGGFVEMGESTEECAVREAQEELGIEVGDLRLLGVYSRRQVGIVTVVYLSEIVAGEPRPTAEALAFDYFGPDELPWDEMAFPSTTSALEAWKTRLNGSHG